jgi:hypothetical protein
MRQIALDCAAGHGEADRAINPTSTPILALLIDIVLLLHVFRKRTCFQKRRSILEDR